MQKPTNPKRCSYHITRVLGIALFYGMLMVSDHAVIAQTYAPQSYWTFDDTNPLKDAMGVFDMNPNYYGSPYTINSGGTVNKHLTLDDKSTLIQLGKLSTDSAFTIEFLFLPGYYFSDSRFFTRVDGYMEARMGYPYINFTTKVNQYSGGTSTDEMVIDLKTVGRKSYGYYVDSKWHHIVFRYNSNTGLKQIWIDGECPAGFSKTTPTGTLPKTTSGGNDLLLNSQFSYVKYYGSYDEMAIYPYWLPDNMIYKHYTQAKTGQHYTHNYTTTAPPAPQPVTAGFDMTEFAPGHPNVNVTATDQLLTFPTPRYKTGHTLMPNIPLYGVETLGGMFQQDVTYKEALDQAKIQQRDLITNFNQSLQITSNSHEYIYYDDTTKFAGYFLKLANNNPQWSTCLNTFWPQVTPTLAGFKSSTPYVTCNCMADHYYLRNSSGQFMDTWGNAPVSNKTLSPVANTDSLVKDGLTQRFYLGQLMTRLTRPLNLIFENGEVIPFVNNSTVLSKDPAVASAQASSGLDWYTFEGRKAKEKVHAYRNQFMSLSGLANTKFAYYQVDGQPTWRFKYSEMRQTSSMINNQYYPTGDIYMRYPDNWRFWSSAWHGWQWLVESRREELALGDKLFSPPVGAGWDVVPENNVRPAQWLGMLKAIAMTGAEFFYPSFFTEHAPYPNSKNWVWQTVMPAYAQAISSRYEEFLRNGYLMEGDVPNNPSNPQWNAYSFKSGDFRKLVVIRKHNSLNKYAITGTLQPNSNMIGNAENEGVAVIKLDGNTIKFKVRRQGSTYIFDNTNASSPVFYQLDQWHEATHPYFWNKDFILEGELYDNASANVTIKTSVPAGTSAGDFTNYTSYVKFNTATDAVYNIVTRKNAPSKYHLWVRARSSDGTSTGFFASIDGANSVQVDCITDTSWIWYRYDVNTSIIAFSGLTTGSHSLMISSSNNKLEVDQIALVASSGAVYGNDIITCNPTVTATITASGTTQLCDGESVSLTASNGTSYLWSTGATTKTINVTSAGNYVVTVTVSGVSATSSPVAVTVNPLPVAKITAGGPTEFCPGGKVTLTASSGGSSYLWAPNGETTSSIDATTTAYYKVTVTNSYGCTRDSWAKLVEEYPVPNATTIPTGNVSLITGSMVNISAPASSAYQWSTGASTQSINVNAAGTYNVTVTNSYGCTAKSPNIVVTVGTTTGCAAPINLTTVQVHPTWAEVGWTDPGTGQTKFQVKIKDMSSGNVYITGKVPNTTISLGIGANPGIKYKWWVRSWCGAVKSGWAGPLTYTTPTQRMAGTANEDAPLTEMLYEDATEEERSGAPEFVLNADEVNLFPNPANNSSTLTFYTETASKFVVSIADLSGKVSEQKRVDAVAGFNLVNLDVTTLSKGVYLVRLSGDSQTVNKRLSVQ